MFTDDFCKDWDSTKNQDDFIKKYFRKIKVNPATTSGVLESDNKSKKVAKKNSSTKLVKQDNEYSCERSNSSLLKNKNSVNFSHEICSEAPSHPHNMQGIELDSNVLKKRKRKKKKKSIESSEHVNIKELNSKYETVTDNSPTDSIKCINLEVDDVNSNYIKPKKKRKRVRDEAKTVSGEKSSTPNNLCDSSEQDNNNNNSDSNCFKLKKRKKLKNIEKPEEPSNKEECVSFEDSYDSSLKKTNLLQSKAYQKLQAAKFRYLNEMLYTTSGKDALSFFQDNTDDFVNYHEGYQSQVSKWPINPVDIIIQEISRIDKQAAIADLGCGEAKIAEVFPNRTVYSFDLIALKHCVTACDMTNVPLLSSSVDVVVFCLSLMGTNWKDYLKEGYRILKFGGTMKIAEIESRIDNLEYFIKAIEHGGFSLLNQNLSHKMFIFLNFKKVKKSKKASRIPEVTLKPCMYKKR